jgi:hypothetical protein
MPTPRRRRLTPKSSRKSVKSPRKSPRKAGKSPRKGGKSPRKSTRKPVKSLRKHRTHALPFLAPINMNDLSQPKMSPHIRNVISLPPIQGRQSEMPKLPEIGRPLDDEDIAFFNPDSPYDDEEDGIEDFDRQLTKSF